MKIESTQIDNTYAKMPGNNTRDDNTTSLTKKIDMTNGVVYAGDLNLNSQTIDDKKQQAQKQALKTIMDQFKNELKSDDNISSLEDKQTELSSDMDDAADQIKNLEQSKQDLQDSYGITDDSTEQKNLDLIDKSIFHPEEMTKEDYKQLKNIGPLTDYQKEAVKTDAMEYIWQKRVDNAANGIHSIDMTITGLKLEKLKTHPMVDAQKEASDIIESATNDIISTLIQQAKDKVDDTIETNKEKTEKQQEEKDKKDKEAGKADNVNHSTDITKTAMDQSDQQKLIDNIKQAADKQKMLEDDIKGIVVDEKV